LLTTTALDDEELLWEPFPRIDDRDAWNQGVPEPRRSRRIEDLTRLADQQFPSLPLSLWQDFARTGNRARFEGRFFERRRQLTGLVCHAGLIGELSDAVTDRLWALLEETTWCVPCHDRRAVPDPTEPVLDLFAAQTGAQMALALHVLRPASDALSPVLAERIRTEIDRRVLTPYLERDDWFWFGADGRHVNNWNPWINVNVLIAGLLTIESADRRRVLVRRVGASLDAYLASMPADGGCTEGQGYWAVAASKLCDACAIIDAASQGRIAAIGLPQIVAAARYPVAMHIGGMFMVQHSDGPARMTENAQLLERYGDPPLQQLARFLRDFPADEHTDSVRPTNLFDQLSDLFDREHHEAPPTPAPFRGTSWFPTTEVLVAREEPGSAEGLLLAVKGGHNAEDHNHNDVGSFSIALDGSPLVIDAGVTTYTAQTFSERRYELWTMQSGWHNLPRINGADQLPGREFAAADVVTTGVETTDAEQVAFRAEIGGAWEDAAVNSWDRDLVLDRPRGRIRLTDTWDVPGLRVLDLPLVCAVEPEPHGEDTLIVSLRVHHPGLHVSAVERQEIPADDRLFPTWGAAVFRLVLTPDRVADAGSWELTFARTDARANVRRS
jgi:hypothetical protein